MLLKRVLSDEGSQDPSIAFEKDFSKVSRQKCNKSLFERVTVEAKICSRKKFDLMRIEPRNPSKINLLL